MARVVFLGTPQAAVPTLESLAAEHDVALIITQPDRRRGRSGTPQAPPVKATAEAHGLQVSQPTKSGDIASVIDAAGPFAVGVVVAYGRILRPEVLALPERGLLNIHFSLLPRWRGAAPVARALMAGDEMTGVTIIKLDEGLDTGPVLTAQAVDIPPDDDAGALTDRLAHLGGRLLLEVLPRYLAGDLEPVPQTDDGLVYADKIEKEERPIAPDTAAPAVVAKVRGLAPEPAATLEIDGDPHKILTARLHDAKVEQGHWSVVDGVPVVGFPGGGVELVILQPPGKKAMSGADWVRGRRSSQGAVS
jgi:methionyl-tRNA formyltransferase